MSVPVSTYLGLLAINDAYMRCFHAYMRCMYALYACSLGSNYISVGCSLCICYGSLNSLRAFVRSKHPESGCYTHCDIQFLCYD